ncbi:methylase involved in ubiquinone/menaquinone biosynthesis [Mycolicibacterium tokaiense]|uniref:Methylase involved in ubiquinone/menaquinone biosynthesis n=2 Tax=Mycolicibacterium tokaiense TaxID=39695 RepID=A0A378TPJ9_9MYCO|nr:methylase involved in ubiquinone/menaquinone biosynthesis [Mycolicibacterium tokaiense]
MQPCGCMSRVVLNSTMGTRWTGTDAPRGDDYDRRWRRLARAGQNVHGEADLAQHLLQETGGTRVLDAGCGTGRVAIELAARGYSTLGVDADEGMLTAARSKAPGLSWVLGDLSTWEAPEPVDLALLAGNVMIYLAPGSEAAVLQRMAATVVDGGLVVAGFTLRPDRLGLSDYDRHAEAAGLTPVHRWATWDRAPFTGGDYSVSVHRK